MKNMIPILFSRMAGNFLLSFCLCLLILLNFSSPAVAAEAGEDVVSLASAEAINDDAMNANRGGTTTNNTNNITTVTSHQIMDSSSSGNSVIVGGNLTNGHISVGDNFGGSGIGSYVMNTGNNATINSGVSLSVLMLQ